MTYSFWIISGGDFVVMTKYDPETDRRIINYGVVIGNIEPDEGSLRKRPLERQ
jgi:hypothetical protein